VDGSGLFATLATKEYQMPITKADIDDFRKLIEMHRNYQTITKRLGKKLKCEFYDVSEWAEKLGSQKAKATDQEIAFAMGRLSFEGFY
jgi:hypothetical protein